MRKASADAGRSINLVVTSRGINALKQANLWEKVKDIVVPVHGRMMHDKKGELTYQPYGRDPSECNYSISRGELNMLLMSEAENLGIKIHFEHEVDSVDFEAKTISFKNGKSYSYDLLFGADGGGSAVRRQLVDFLGEADSTQTVRPLGADYKEFLMPATNTGDYAIEKNALHIWPRGAEMLMALPNLDGSFTMTLYMPTESFDKIKGHEDLREYFENNYPDGVPLMPDYSKEYFENPQGKLATLNCSPWHYKDSVCLIGDAAHAIVPFFGQGMNAGFEDCATLLTLIKGSDNWSHIFKEYDRIQKPAGDAIAEMAIQNFTEMSSKVGDEKFLLKKKIEHKIETTYPELYRSRYGMVTYTLIPYNLCLEAGLIQQEILNELTQNLTCSEDLDLGHAHALLMEKFTPFIERNQINLTRFKE
jgi:kynurenine 3-monooxygenase